MQLTLRQLEQTHLKSLHDLEKSPTTGKLWGEDAQSFRYAFCTVLRTENIGGFLPASHADGSGRSRESNARAVLSMLQR